MSTIRLVRADLVHGVDDLSWQGELTIHRDHELWADIQFDECEDVYGEPVDAYGVRLDDGHVMLLTVDGVPPAGPACLCGDPRRPACSNYWRMCQ